MVKINIDGQEHDVEEGKNLLDACLGLGLDLPYFCWHPSMGSVGSCRQCAVRVYRDENDSQGKILMACMTMVADGMRLGLEEKTVSEFRDTCIEVTMANHPHDCPVCEEGGECHLQDVTIMSNHTSRRYRGKKKTYENQDLGPCIGHEMNRCITCYRCVRFYKDYAGGKDLAAMASRENTYFGRHEDGCLESVFSGNLAEVCPTGVFTDKTLARSYNRKWDLQTAPSICHGCSLGCNIAPAERHGQIKRITNRYHGEINGYFICDKGRFAYDHVNSDQRVRACRLDGEKKSDGDSSGDYSGDYRAAIEVASASIGAVGLKNVIGIGSETASVEENFLLKQLVGSKNFCSGMSASRQALLKEILAISRHPAIELVSMKSMEACDAVIVLGEDLLNSAPRMALSVRQATRNLSFDMADAARIPRWQDESVRILAQESRSPLVIATVAGSDLDEIASDTLLAKPDDIANFGFAIAHEIDSGFASAMVSKPSAALAKKIAGQLLQAKNPLVISGCSLNSIKIVQAAAQISAALAAKKSNGKKVSTASAFVLPQANSMGLAMLLDENSVSVDALARDLSGKKAAIVLQNDLYHHGDAEKIAALLKGFDSTTVLSQLENRTTDHADVLIPAASFVETEGTLVNNEGRAQRFFEVFASDKTSVRDNWLTLCNIAGAIVETSTKKAPEHLLRLASLKQFDDVVNYLQSQGGVFSNWSQIAPDAAFRIAGMKMPRQPHRYSGRTSLKADIKVSEDKATVDDDSALGFTMEGAPINRPPALNAMTWSPGWNSNEAVNKFQDEIGGQLRGGDPGVMLIEKSALKKSASGINFLPVEKAATGQLLAVSQSRIFDGCERTMLSSALAQRAEGRVARMSARTAADFSLQEGEGVQISVAPCAVTLPLKIDSAMPDGVVTVPDDIQTRLDLSAAMLPAACAVARGVEGSRGSNGG